jgi:hypothetical protein
MPVLVLPNLDAILAGPVLKSGLLNGPYSGILGWGQDSAAPGSTKIVCAQVLI